MQAWAQHALIILPDIIRQKYQTLSNLYDRFSILDDRLLYVLGKPLKKPPAAPGHLKTGMEKSSSNGDVIGFGQAFTCDNVDRSQCGSTILRSKNHRSGATAATPTSDKTISEISMKPVSTDAAPAAIGPYSQAIAVNGLLFVSGQIPIDPTTGEFSSNDPVEQTRQCLRNLAAIAEAAGTDLSRTVKTTVLVRDLSRFADINAAYAEFFKAPFPARATFEVSALPKGAQIEIEAVIALKDA